MEKYKRVTQESLKVGDVLHLIWCGDKHIISFEEYDGPLDFVERKAVFAEGGRMSLSKDRYYEVLEDCNGNR